MSYLADLLSSAAALTRDVRSRDWVCNRIFMLTAATGRVRRTPKDVYMKKWLPSQNFTLCTVPVSEVENHIKAKFPSIVKRKIKWLDTEPIVIDKNKPSNRWPGKTIVIDGKHRLTAAQDRGDKVIQAWIGDLAMPYFTPEGDNEAP